MVVDDDTTKRKKGQSSQIGTQSASNLNESKIHVNNNKNYYLEKRTTTTIPRTIPIITNNNANKERES